MSFLGMLIFEGGWGTVIFGVQFLAPMMIRSVGSTTGL